jgi:esterase FrsA
MNDVAELKRYVGVHARGQRIPRYQLLLDRISTDADGPGSWVGEWCAEAARLEERGRHLDACRHYIMARFPYVDGPGRQEAYARALAAFEKWRVGRNIHRLHVDIDGERVGCWQTGLSTAERLPLLVLMGGIVSVKEQWAPALPVLRRLGMATVVLDMPGTGENPLCYSADSWRMLSRLLDAVADRADVSSSYMLTLSFSGHLALRCAMADSRIKGVVTAGAPISEFFTDTAWQSSLPRITVDTLAHLTGVKATSLPDELSGRALPAAALSALDIPVGYVASLRDEIIPRSDLRMLREHVRRLWVLEHDDVHAAPRHVAESQLWIVHALLRTRGVRNAHRLILSLLWRAARVTSKSL